VPAAASSLILVALARLIGSTSESPLLGGGYEADIRRHGSGNSGGGTHMRGTLTWCVDLMRRTSAQRAAALAPFAHCGEVRRPRADNGLRFERVRPWRLRA